MQHARTIDCRSIASNVKTRSNGRVLYQIGLLAGDLADSREGGEEAGRWNEELASASPRRAEVRR
jgi:hypothetical protein